MTGGHFRNIMPFLGLYPVSETSIGDGLWLGLMVELVVVISYNPNFASFSHHNPTNWMPCCSVLPHYDPWSSYLLAKSPSYPYDFGVKSLFLRGLPGITLVNYFKGLNLPFPSCSKSSPPPPGACHVGGHIGGRVLGGISHTCLRSQCQNVGDLVLLQDVIQHTWVCQMWSIWSMWSMWSRAESLMHVDVNQLRMSTYLKHLKIFQA